MMSGIITNQDFLDASKHPDPVDRAARELGLVGLKAGSQVIGKAGIDQTADGATNRVVAKISQVAGENVIKDADSGAKIDAAVMPAGGSGLLGWLSAIWTRLAGVVLAAGDAVVGRVKLTDGTTVASVDAATGGVKTLAQGITPVELKGSNALKGALATVATAGTRVRLPDYPCREVTIIARRLNTGSVFVGGADVSANVFGAELRANDSLTLTVSNTNLVYIDAAVAGEGISHVAI